MLGKIEAFLRKKSLSIASPATKLSLLYARTLILVKYRNVTLHEFRLCFKWVEMQGNIAGYVRKKSLSNRGYCNILILLYACTLILVKYVTPGSGCAFYCGKIQGNIDQVMYKQFTTPFRRAALFLKIYWVTEPRRYTGLTVTL